MTGFNDWILVEPTPMASEKRWDEVDRRVRERLSQRAEPELKARIDPGVDLASAQRAQAVRVRESEGRIVIDEHDHASVLRGSTTKTLRRGSKGIMGLFTMGDGVPDIVERADGSRSPVYRTINEGELFGTTTSDDELVERTMSETIQRDFVDAFEGAVRDVNLRYPGQ